MEKEIIVPKEEKGTRLSTYLQTIDPNYSIPCGGHGVCQRCQVIVNGKEELSCQYLLLGGEKVIYLSTDE